MSTVRSNAREPARCLFGTEGSNFTNISAGAFYRFDEINLHLPSLHKKK